jgi:hypothetical protein
MVKLRALVLELLALVLKLPAIVSATMTTAVVGFGNGRSSYNCRND